LTQKVIDEMIAPKDESSEIVLKWLESQGLSRHASVSPRSDAVIVDASVSQVEKLLEAEYSAFSKKSLFFF
jgi:tripeptidyl-peptidase-1